MKSVVHDTRIARVLNRNAGTAGSTVSSDWVDTTGAVSTCFLVAFQDVVAGAVITVRVRHADTAAGSGAEVLAGSVTHTADATSADNRLVAIEVARPTKRYVQVQVVIATQNAPLDGAIAVQTVLGRLPGAHGDTVLATRFIGSPVTE